MTPGDSAECDAFRLARKRGERRGRLLFELWNAECRRHDAVPEVWSSDRRGRAERVRSAAGSCCGRGLRCATGKRIRRTSASPAATGLRRSAAGRLRRSADSAATTRLRSSAGRIRRTPDSAAATGLRRASGRIRRTPRRPSGRWIRRTPDPCSARRLRRAGSAAGRLRCAARRCVRRSGHTAERRRWDVAERPAHGRPGLRGAVRDVLLLWRAPQLRRRQSHAVRGRELGPRGSPDALPHRARRSGAPVSSLRLPPDGLPRRLSLSAWWRARSEHDLGRDHRGLRGPAGGHLRALRLRVPCERLADDDGHRHERGRLPLRSLERQSRGPRHGDARGRWLDGGVPRGCSAAPGVTCGRGRLPRRGAGSPRARSTRCS